MPIRLYTAQRLASGTFCELSPEQCNYLHNVMRLKEGEIIHIFNGQDGEWAARIANISKKHGSLVLESQTRKQQEVPDFWLAFAPIKHGRIDWLVEKATELGVAKLLPVQTKHTIVNRVNVERLQAHALEAAEQSERLSVPEVAELVELQKLIQGWDGSRKIIVCDETGSGKPMLEALQPFKSTEQKWALLIGPEGGFAKAELEKLRSLPYVISVGLGPRVLRADTAALSALTCLQAALGDWHNAPRFETKA